MLYLVIDALFCCFVWFSATKNTHINAPPFTKCLECLQPRLQTLSFHHTNTLTQQWLCFVSQICSHQMYLQVRPFILSTLRKKSPYSSKLQTASRPLNRSLTFPVASVDPIRSWSFARGHCVHHTWKTVAGATQRIHVPTREVRPNPKQCFFFLVIKKDGWASCWEEFGPF